MLGVGDFCLARLATVDVIDGIRLDAALDGSASFDADASSDFVARRTVRVAPSSSRRSGAGACDATRSGRPANEACE